MLFVYDIPLDGLRFSKLRGFLERTELRQYIDIYMTNIRSNMRGPYGCCRWKFVQKINIYDFICANHTIFIMLSISHCVSLSMSWHFSGSVILKRAVFESYARVVFHWNTFGIETKANLRDLIAATGLVILLKLDRIINFSARVTSKFIGWPRKIIGHLFYTTSRFVHNFKSISEFKLELQSGNAQFRSKSTIFFSRVTLQFDVWPWNTIEHLFYATSICVHHFVAIDEFKLVLQSGNAQFGQNWPFFVSCDLQIWWMTLKKNRAPLLCHIKLCA